MPFPLRTQQWASSVASAIKSSDSLFRVIGFEGRPSGKKGLAELLHYGLQNKYGFTESLRTGNWTPWPDECTQVNCYSQSIINYVVARSCGLNPHIMEFVGLQKEGGNFSAGHSLVVVDVGEDRSEPWVIDQPMRMYGPVTINENSISVQNFDKGAIGRGEPQTVNFNFISSIRSDEEDIVEQVEQLRENPEVVLWPGQRLGISLGDAWQSESPIEAPWYLKFIPSRSSGVKGDVVSRLLMDRPGVKSRGVEYRMTLDDSGRVIDENVWGVYCDGLNWAEFVNPVPIVRISLDDMLLLTDGLLEIPPNERPGFERELMEEGSLPSSKYLRQVRAARESFEAMRESEYENVVVAISTAEALFQDEKGPGKYLGPDQRKREIMNRRRENSFFDSYAKWFKEHGKLAKARKRIGAIGSPNSTMRQLVDRAGFLLDPNRTEDPQVLAYLAIDTQYQMIEHMLRRQPFFIDDSVDRLVFYGRRIKGNEHRLKEIAEAKFGGDYERQVFAGYLRIFGEFLGHFAASRDSLCLNGYKEGIIEKLH